MRKHISEREEEIQKGELGKLMKIAVEDKKIISLGPGEPDFTPPKHIITAAKQALDKGFTHYSPVEGRKELLEEVSKKLKRENKINVSPDEVVITNGSNEAILLALMCVVDPGEFALVPDPGFVAYRGMIELLNGYPVSMPLRFENNFQIDIDEVKKLIEPEKTKAIIINTPSNPTGAVLSKKNLEEIAKLAIEHNLLIISDEAYEKFVYNGKHISIGSLNGLEDTVVTLQTFSKTYGMAGFRVGYAAGPRKFINAMRSLMIYSTVCAPTPSQMAAIAALRGPQNFSKKIINDYNKRRKYIVRRLNEMEGLKCLEPDGAFYVFPKIELKLSSKELFRYFLDKAKVLTIPGTDFGKYGEGFIRFSYATKFSSIEKAMDRIEKVIKKL